MSAEDGSSQPPPAPTEKTSTLKPAGFSSFINKNPTGKKVAPKAARRRPGAAASAASTSKAPVPIPTASTAEAQPAQTETSSSTVSTVEPPAASQLPTPAATQEPVPQSIPQTEQNVREPAASTTESSIATTSPIAVVEPSPTPTNTQDATQQDNNGESVAQLSPTQSATPRPAEEELESDRSPKRQRVEAAVRKTHKPRPVARRNVASKPVAETSATTPQSAQFEIQAAIDPLPPQSTDETLQTTETTSTSSANTPTETSASIDKDRGADETPATDVATTTQKPKPRAGRRKLPSWSTINKPPGWEEQVDLEEQIEAEEISDAGAGTRSRPTAKARGKRKTATPVAVEGAELQENEESEEEVQAASRRPAAKARGKRKATSATVNDNSATVEPAPKKPRKTRKDKGTTRNKPDGAEEEIEGEGEEGEHGEHGEATKEAAAHSKKKKAPRTKKATRSAEPGVNAEGADGEQGRQRKSREREPTPSDAEDQTIDPETTFMSNIASRNIRVGKLSERERKMREINWVEVKQRRVEERELAVSGGRAARNQVDEELARAGAAREELAAEQSSGPRFQMIDGQITLIQDSGNINREADADRMIELMEEVAEDDLTAPINSSSYMRDNKRFPEHFMVPGQGTRWGREATDNFYDALRRFGTDFAMINKCFPHSTRRSIKKKFNREEKEHPELIKEALSAPRNTDWTSFLVDAGKEDDDFADVDRIKAELAELQKEADVLIKQAQDKAVEEKRQRRLAGAELTDDENPEGSAKENGKKKKKSKGKQVQFAQEENFEVVGTLDDDPNWGVE